MQIISVEGAGSSYFVRHQKGTVHLRSHDDGPLPLLPGWRPKRILAGVGNLAIMELRNELEHSGTWFLDRKLRYMTNNFDSLSSDLQSAIIKAVPSFPIIPWEDFENEAIETRFSVDHVDISSIEINGIRLFNTPSPAELVEFSASWQENEYLVVKNALTAEAMTLLNSNISFSEASSITDERQFYRMHNDKANYPFINKFLSEACTYYETILSMDLTTSYAFAMNYIKGADMQPHYDNRNTPLSSTVCYKFESDGSRNPLYLDRAKFLNPYTERLTVKDRDGIPKENVVRIDLGAGDIAIFRGRTHLHWRDPILTEMDYRAILLHFNDFRYKGIMRKSQDIPHIPNVLVDFDSYDKFRDIYAMYFENTGRGWV